MKKQKKRIHKCSMCNKPATWYYLPSSDGKRFFCDDCVPRGCSCNVYDLKLFGEPDNKENIIWWSKENYHRYLIGESNDIDNLSSKERQKDSFYYEYLDKNGKRLPCCEYDYDEQGQEFYEKVLFINKQDIIAIFEKEFSRFTKRDYLPIQSKQDFYNFFNKYPEKINYNEFMNSFITFIYEEYHKKYHTYTQDFVNSFKFQCYDKHYKEYID